MSTDDGRLIIIPVYNEEETIEAVLGELCRHYSGQVLIVDDGSTDRSVQRIHACLQCRTTVISHPVNRGYGASLIDGFRFALEQGFKTVLTMDCDFQHEPQQVPSFFAQIGESDILSGSRYLAESICDTVAPPDRMRINQIVTARINELTGYGITDAFCGFKAYRTEIFRELELDETGYAFPLQFWIRARARGLSVRELAVARIYTGAKRSFGAMMDNPESRLNYYQEVIDREYRLWKRT